MWEHFIVIVIGGLFSGVILYIIKGFFTQIKEQIAKVYDDMKKVEDRCNQGLSSHDVKIDKILDGNMKIYNDILHKFSNWEDRLKKNLDDITTKQVEAGKNAPFELRRELINSLAELDNTVKKDMKEVRVDIMALQSHIRDTEQIVNDMQINDNDKKILRELLRGIDKMEETRSMEVKDFDEKLRKIFSICTLLTNENKELEKKIKEVETMSKQRIRLT